MFQAGQMLSSIMNRAATMPQRQMELTQGQVVKGTVLKVFPDNMALVQVNGMQMNAKMEVGMEVGQRAWMQVQSTSSPVTMKVLTSPENPQEAQDASIEGLMRSLGLPETKEGKVIVQTLLNRNLPVSKEAIQSFVSIAKSEGLSRELVDAFITAYNRNLPLTKEVVTSLKSFLSGNTMTDHITSFVKLADAFLAREAKAAGNQASAGNAGAAAKTLGETVALLKEKLLGLPLQLDGDGLMQTGSGVRGTQGNGGGIGANHASATGLNPNLAGSSTGATTSGVGTGIGANGQGIGGAFGSVGQNTATMGNTGLSGNQGSVVGQGATGNAAQSASLNATGTTAGSNGASVGPGVNPANVGANAGIATGVNALTGDGTAGSVQTNGNANAGNPAGSPTTGAGNLSGSASTGNTATPSNASGAANPASLTGQASSTNMAGTQANSASAGTTQSVTGSSAGTPNATTAGATSNMIAGQNAGNVSPLNSPSPQSIQNAVSTTQPDPATANPNQAGNDHSQPVKEVLRQLGIMHERQLSTGMQAAGDQQADTQLQSIKSLLLSITQSTDSNTPQGLRNAADALLQQVTGQQLMLTQPANQALTQIIMQVPLRTDQGEDTAFIQIESKKREGGQLDPENCRLFFNLDLKQLGITMVDVNIVNKIINVSIFNDQPWIGNMMTGMRDMFSEQLRDVGYQLSNLRVQPIPEEKAAPAQTLQKGTMTAPYKGVDIRL
ncbi:hypothetical protein [Brevibacillus dissolubilis]|uniref:hypothetical protein n=1 Tax=Brevibacillus dissolubilis TaxID=1844116 RepID=UPI00111608A1|nr:hypothetical protein [Brevibacillus dissolubilis]